MFVPSKLRDYRTDPDEILHEYWVCPGRQHTPRSSWCFLHLPTSSTMYFICMTASNCIIIASLLNGDSKYSKHTFASDRHFACIDRSPNSLHPHLLPSPSLVSVVFHLFALFAIMYYCSVVHLFQSSVAITALVCSIGAVRHDDATCRHTPLNRCKIFH